MKVFVFDVDGTLLTLGERTILESTKEALRKLKENGNILAVASGRSYEIIDPRLIELNVFDYFICSRGAILYKDGVRETISTIDEDTIQKLLKKTIDTDGFMDVWYSEGIKTLYNDAYCEDLYIKFIGKEGMQEYLRSEVKGQPINGDIWIPHEKLEEWRNEFPHINFLSNTYKCFYEYTPKGQSKGVALQQICKELNLNNSDVIAFGDSDNDIEMLKFAGVSIAMGNATDSVKEVSDYITSDVSEDGIYNACKHFNWI